MNSPIRIATWFACFAVGLLALANSSSTRFVSSNPKPVSSQSGGKFDRPLVGTWSQQTSGTTNSLFSVHFVNANEGWAVGLNNTILHTTNGGANWTAQTNQGGVPVSSYLGVRFIDSNTGWAGGGSVVVRTTDGGTSWTSLGAPPDARFRNNLFAVSSNAAWIPARDGASRWFSRLTVGVGEENFNVLGGSSQYFDIYFTDADNGWSVGTGPIVHITNGSSASPSFAFQTSCPCPTLNGLHMLDANTGWAVGNGGLILKTTNGGSTWPSQISGTTTNLRSVHFVDANTGWAVGAGGLILISTNGGTSWTQETSGVSTELRRVFFVNANTGYAVGVNGTILKRTDVPVPMTFVVTNTNDSGAGSLRQAIADANANPESDTIIFNIPTSDPNYDGSAFTIHLTSGELVLTGDGTFIDGSSQAAFAGDTNPNGPEIVLDRSFSTCGASGCNGLKIQSSNNHIHQLVINQSAADGIALSAGATGNMITGCYIGTDASGTSQSFINFNGISSAGGNTIGGTATGEGNLISGCGGFGAGGLSLGAGDIVRGNRIGTNTAGTSGIANAFYGITAPAEGGILVESNLISGNSGDGVVLTAASLNTRITKGTKPTTAPNIIRGNKIGTDTTGLSALANINHGINIAGPNSQIGGTTPADRNIISGNGLSGVFIQGSTATGNIVQGNYIGTNLNGTAALANHQSGVNIEDAPGNTIGGTTTGARNIISGHTSQNGVFITGSTASSNIVQGNYIGTDVNGTTAIGNLIGVGIAAPNNMIGGAATGAGNLISGNTRGLSIVIASGNVAQGNFIGTNAAGTVALGNTMSGVYIAAPNNTIGGTATGARNLISGNGLHGVELNSSTGTSSATQVIGNYIGTDITGTLVLGNVGDGVNIYASANNVIGGPSSAARNVISGNNGNGVYIESNSLGNSDGTTVQGNFIGTQADGSTQLPNSQIAVLLIGNTSNNQIGGTASGAGNLIAYSSGAGVSIQNGTGNAILSNSIYANAGLGIDLSPSGVTPNDPGDVDTSLDGPNNLQNFPVLTSATSSAGSTSILGTLHSTASTMFRIEFFASSTCDPSGHGEGTSFLGAINVTTDSGGVSSFVASLPVAVASGQVVTATATDSANNTSEFSSCVTVPLIALSPPTLPGGMVGTSYNQTITAAGGGSPYTFAVTAGALPAGLMLSSGGALTGTPTVGGSFTFTVTATDATSQSANRSYTLAVSSSCAATGFVGPTNFATGAQPFSIAVGDFNGDSKLDLAVANNNSSSVSILVGNGLGGFSAPTNFDVGSNPKSIAAGDFNGDNKLDLAVANSGSSSISVLLGDGTGSFGAATNFSAGAQPLSVTVGDFNGDNKLDLAVANSGSLFVSILPGNGAGSFGAAINSTVGAGQSFVAAGDFNGDNKLDLALASNSALAVFVVLGDGAGNFSASTTLPTGSSPRSIAVGDFNRDGKLDLAVVALNPARVLVFLGDGASGFDVPASYPTGQLPQSVAAGDLDGDGNLDFAVTNNASNVSIFPGNGAGGFAAATTLSTGFAPVFVALGDFNRDGHADLAVANANDNDVSILVKNCCPTITLSPTPLPGGTTGATYNQPITASGGTAPYMFAVTSGALPSGLMLSTGGVISGMPSATGTFAFTITATDAHGCSGSQSYSIQVCPPIALLPITLADATLSVAYNQTITASGGTSPYSFSIVTGGLPQGLSLSTDGMISGMPSLTGSFSFTITATDTNGCAGGRNYTIKVISATPCALQSLNGPTPFSAGSGPRYVALADFNGDSKLDLAIANASSTTVTILLGNGAGGFGSPTSYAVGSSPLSIAVGDFNSDTKLDIATANQGSADISIILGNGSGGFGSPTNFSTGTVPSSILVSIAVGDFNLDDKLDLTVADLGADKVLVLLGNGAGSFGTPVGYPAGTDPFSVVVSDFNGDGKPDIAVANTNSANVSVFIGNGAGGFSAATNFNVGSAPQSLAVGDFNNDNQPDLVTANLTSHNVSILLGDGVGGFGTATNFPTGTNPQYAAVGDFNGDGRADLAVSIFSGGSLAILTGNGAGSFSSPTNFSAGNIFAIGVGDFNGDGKPDAAATDFNNNVVRVFLNACVDCHTIAIAPSSLPNGAVGSVYNQSLTGSGGLAPYTFAVTSGSLPGGLTLSTGGVLSGTPTASGPFTFTVTATDAAGCTGSRGYTLTINSCPAPITLLPATLAAGTLGVAYSQTITASGGVSPYTFSLAVGVLPAGLTLASNGALTGTPTVAGSFTFTVTATDANGCAGHRVYTLGVAAVNPCLAAGFSGPTSFSTGTSPVSVASGDFNGDNKLDLVTANANSNNISILLGDGAGGFGGPTNITIFSTPFAVAVGDFNSDNKLDIVVAKVSSGSVALLLGDEMGGFGAPVDIAAVPSPRYVAVADFNGDGRVDLAVANGASGNVTILLGNGAGGFGMPTDYFVGDAQNAIALGDFNGDGRIDLACAGTGSNVFILLGNGTGGFGAATNFGVSSQPLAIAAGDFNSDGKLDLATADYNTSKASILLGNGAGGFGAATAINTGSHPRSIVVGDFNNDGRADFAVANESSNNVAVHLGDGAGGFSAGSGFDLGAVVFYVIAGRFNADARLDLVATVSSSGGAVLLNDCCGYSLSPASAFFSVTGSEGAFNLTTFPGCSWNASSNDSWIELTSEASGSGPTEISYIVRDNFSPVPRVGTITVAGLTFTITQDSEAAPDCTYNISPLFESHPATGGSGSINVATDERCAWQAVSDASWITITSGCCAIGNGSVTYSVAANPGPSGRARTITIGGKTFNVKQKGN